MIQEQQVTLRILTPDVEGNWRYKEENGKRIFTQLAYLGVNDSEENWIECTPEEKETWEREHPEEPIV